MNEWELGVIQRCMSRLEGASEKLKRHDDALSVLRPRCDIAYVLGSLDALLNGPLASEVAK